MSGFTAGFPPPNPPEASFALVGAEAAQAGEALFVFITMYISDV